MALAKERTAPESTSHVSVFHQACSYYGNMYGGHPDPSIGFFGLENYTKMVTGVEGDGAEKNDGSIKNYALNRLPSLNDENMNPSSATVYDQNMDSSPEEEGHHDDSVLNFKAGHGSGNWMQSSNGSLLSFDHGEGVMDYNYLRVSEDENCFDTTSTGYAKQGSQLRDQDRFGWLYSGGSNGASIPEARLFADHTNHHNKRPHTDGDEDQVNKKHCSNGAKKPKAKTVAPSKDPQSIAAKNRRERISERLKILQDLVPNGTKVDLVTMLEKAISYVKFLQLQVKVLATDEFWPAQGGKAPEVAQVKEAIDAILSSHHSSDRNSSSK